MSIKIWHKIVAAPGVAIGFLVLLGALSYGVMTRQVAVLDDMYSHRFANYQLAANSAQAISEVHSNVYRLFTWLSNLKEDKISQITTEQKVRIDEVSKTIGLFAKAADTNGEEQKLAETIIKDLAKYKRDALGAIEMSTVDVNTGMLSMQTADDGFQKMLKNIDGLVQIERRLAHESYESARTAFNRMVLALVAILFVAVAISGAMTFFMSRMIVQPLKRAIAAAGRIAGGDLSSEIHVVGRDETAELLGALAHMKQNLRTLVGEVAAGAHTVADTSEQIAQGNLDLSQRTEEQASTLEETASSMEELTSTVTQNAQNARLASELAVSASEVARKGGQAVGQVVSTMTGISQSSARIADIISVIDGIAFQTNILALNAAVEAARAGEQGRGFAVVAAEVRTLAQRSAAAAKEIKTLIGESVDKVQAGTKQVDAAGQTMAEIVGSVKKVSDLIAEIAAASQEQSSGIGQVNTAVTQMDQVVQQNASLVEEATAATESMKAQAATLLQLVSRFQLEASGASSAAPTPMAATSHRRAPVPVKTRTVEPRLAANFGALIPATTKSANGEWKEF